MTMTESATLKDQARAARAASRRLAAATTDSRNAALLALADALQERQAEIIEVNQQDLAAAEEAGMGLHLTERMTLNPERVAGMAEAARVIAALPDPVGEVLEQKTLANGLKVERIRVPLGVIGVIYESRPNVTIDIAALCLKSGNAVILRGGKEAFRTNALLAEIVRVSIEQAGLPGGAVQFVNSTDRALVGEMLQMKDDIDLMIPRGSAELVHMVAEDATMPAITGGVGVCHTYVDSAADVGKAVDIVLNAKTQRPTVCNALDTVLVHAGIAVDFLPRMAKAMRDAGVEMRCDRRALSVIGPTGSQPIGEGQGSAAPRITAAAPEDFGQEFLSLVAAVRVVDSLDEAMEHIVEYGSGHSEAIVTEDKAAAERFLAEVDAAAVFHNTSTRFNDGGEFGLGAEVAISTNKLHARGPMGLREITSYKWVVRGDGQVRE
ncbi:MAG: glutamate-5-semialdehyde dehydrogenase [Dehalococcoidia bacterium]